MQLNAHRHRHRTQGVQRAKTGVHFGTGAACPCVSIAIIGPHPGVSFGQILNDAKRLPDRLVAIVQARHLTVRGEGPELLPAATVFEHHQAFDEIHAEFGQKQPRPQRPGRIVFVTNVEGIDEDPPHTGSGLFR
ncbi:MAG: hypothetical protein VB948_16535 [Pseudomonadales bacterium]